MKVIDLLNKIANGEEIPEKIKIHNYYCYYMPTKNQYVDYKNEPILEWDYIVMNSLNDEVEIIEENKKIEKLEKFKNMIYQPTITGKYIEPPTEYDMVIAKKIDEIIEVINNGNDGS